MRTLNKPNMLYYIHEKNVKYDIQFRMEDAQQEFMCHDEQDIVKVLNELLKYGFIAPLEGVKSAYRMTEAGLAFVNGYLAEMIDSDSEKEVNNEQE